jgi:GNAT superfamily N-acetyltransferase
VADEGRRDAFGRGPVVREYRPGDGDALRQLWRSSGFRLLGDDDEGLAAFVARNPGLFLVAIAGEGAEVGERIVASAMGGWDGHRGWIYHVATAETHRRTGIASALVARIEDRLMDLGAPRVNVLVQDDSDGGHEFWLAAGYELVPSRQFGKTLGD